MHQSKHQLPLNLADDFSLFRSQHEDRLHFAAHSHHFWPNVTRDAQLECWDDAARLSDRKWEHVLSGIWADVRNRIAAHLDLQESETLVPAPNTHELVSRLLSCLPQGQPARILTSDSEFHSFRRQSARLEEEGLAELTTIAAEPFSDFAERFTKASRAEHFDLVFVSQVFFNSGFAIEPLAPFIETLEFGDALVVVDGYHGFLARPTDLSSLADRIFYLAGGYKYAMAGEGACFMHCPPGVAARPLNTGWYAGFGGLAGKQAGVPYEQTGWRFMGSTFDPSGLYRLRASLRWLAEKGLTVDVIHAHARALQDQFLEGVSRLPCGPIQPSALLLWPDRTATGNFLTFEHGQASALFETLQRHGIDVDYRDSRLRFGFGLYHTASDVQRLLERLSAIDW